MRRKASAAETTYAWLEPEVEACPSPHETRIRLVRLPGDDAAAHRRQPIATSPPARPPSPAAPRRPARTGAADVAARVRKATAALAAGRAGEAVELLEGRLAGVSGSAAVEAQLVLARALLAESVRPRAAVEPLLAVLAIEPDHVPALLMLGHLYRDAGWLGRAARYLCRARALEPTSGPSGHEESTAEKRVKPSRWASLLKMGG